jgi:hypothetical protein
MQEDASRSDRLPIIPDERPGVQFLTEQHSPLSRNQFCNLLRRDSGPVKICLQVHNQNLFRLKETDDAEQILARAPSISLAQVLTLYDLSTKMKLYLSYILAHSVWQYYDSDWTGVGWTCESIHFMPEQRRATTFPSITCRPFLAVRFENDPHVVPECSDLTDVSHKFPRILALGTLLVDIGWGERVQDPLRDTYSPDQKINNDWAAGRLVKDDADWPRIGLADRAGDSLRKLYRDAALACFDKNLYKRTLDAQSRRKVLFDRVVESLRKALALVDWECTDIPQAIPLKALCRESRGPLSGALLSRHVIPGRFREQSMVRSE